MLYCTVLKVNNSVHTLVEIYLDLFTLNITAAKPIIPFANTIVPEVHPMLRMLVPIKMHLYDVIIRHVILRGLNSHPA